MPKNKVISRVTDSLELINVTDVDLLRAVAEITLRDGPLTDADKLELDAINQEFQRRESLTLLK